MLSKVLEVKKSLERTNPFKLTTGPNKCDVFQFYGIKLKKAALC